jgi:tripartite ATP-independent transporter DctM subunit
VARKRGYETAAFPGVRVIAVRMVAALPGLLLVFVIFGGIRAGIFTAVESASVAVLYAIGVTALLYRDLKLAEFFKACSSAAHSAGIILFVISSAAAFGWLLAYLQVPAQVVSAIRVIADDPVTILILMNVVLLLLGTFMDMAPLIIICTPIFLPVATAFGIDPLQFGTVLVLNAGIGLITPPVGSVLFVGTAIGKITIAEAVRTIWPFYFAGLAVLLLVTYLPELSLWLPRMLR